MGSVVADTSLTSADARSRPLVVLLGVAAVIIVLDQLTKWWALEALTDPVRIVDLVWTLRLRVIYNTGTAFSLTSDSGPYVSVVAVAVVGYLVYSGRRQRNAWILSCYGMIVGGTLGNLIDRVARDGDGYLGGPVIDFLDAQWFPVFNVADAALVIGIILLLLIGIRTDGAAFAEETVPDGDSVLAEDNVPAEDIDGGARP